MILTPLHDPSDGQMLVAGLMSGSGSNLRKIIEYEKTLDEHPEFKGSPFHVTVIFSDRYDSNAARIGKDFDLPVVIRDIGGFYEKRGIDPKDLDARVEYDAETVAMLNPFGATVAAYAGYMSVATSPLIEAFLGVNVHPANLSAMENGKRKYTGDKAVEKAILAGEKYIHSTTHIIEPKVDYGSLLMVSRPLEVDLGEDFNPEDKGLVKTVAKMNQERLKEVGDWDIFPQTLRYLALGMYKKDPQGNLYFQDKAIPSGLQR